MYMYAWWNVQGLYNPLPDGGSKLSSPPAVNWSRRRAEMALEIELEPDATSSKSYEKPRGEDLSFGVEKCIL